MYDFVSSENLSHRMLAVIKTSGNRFSFLVSSVLLFHLPRSLGAVLCSTAAVDSAQSSTPSIYAAFVEGKKKQKIHDNNNNDVHKM